MIPWKLILVMAVAVLLALFIGFNLDNKCEISFVFGRVQAVPVYLTILISFVAGLAAALPFSFKRSLGKRPRKGPKAADAPSPGGQAAVIAPEAQEPKAGAGMDAPTDAKEKQHAGKKKSR